MIKYAQAEARQWYAVACERARSAMLPTAGKLVQLSQALAAPAESPARTAALKDDAAELTARVRACYDVAETLRSEHELAQALPYYEATCEFSALAETIGETVPTFGIYVERGCAATQATRAALHSPPFSAELLQDLAEQARDAATAASEPAQDAPEMVFSMSEL